MKTDFDKDTLMLEIDSIARYEYKYSICTLVTNYEEYKIQVNSFIKAGFTNKNSEFIFIDNTNENKYDAYQGINKLINVSRGQYIIIAHQDVELIFDNESKLNSIILEMNQIDPNWSLLGNAGGNKLNNLVIRITDPHCRDVSKGNFPIKVDSLDENFLLLKSEANLSLSNDLNGFHFYGTDIVLLADIRGYTSYVIDFHLLHKSPGNTNYIFHNYKKDFIKKYNQSFRSRIIQTTCTYFYLSSSKFKSILMNKFFLKRIRKLFKENK